MSKSETSEIKLVMTDAEKILFLSFLRCSNNYLEFGSGGSTIEAVALVKGQIISVDSSKEWQSKVSDALGARLSHVEMFHVDIGPVGNWGAPTEESDSASFRSYSTSIWDRVDPKVFDLFLIDGRFRVACFAEIIRRSNKSAFIFIHDYDVRPEYHVVEAISKRIASVENLSLFVSNVASSSAVDVISEAYSKVSI